MKYALISSERSPFGRICRMLMIQNSIPFEFKILNFVDDRAHAQELARLSPINKVPILEIEERGGRRRLFDSRVIANHLIASRGLAPLALDEENIVSAVYSCLDVSVALFLMKRDGFDIAGPGFFLTRQRGRLSACLEFIEPWAHDLQAPRDWNLASMSLYAYLEWAEKRAGLLRAQDHPVFADFLARFGSAPGVRETAIA